VIVRTSRFAIHVNAYVAYYARAISARAGLPEGTDAGALETTDAGEADGDRGALVARVTALGRCSDDACARAALDGTPYAAGLDGYLREKWGEDANDARHALGRVGTPILELEDLLAPTLATQIGRVWPSDPVDVYLARGEGAAPEGRRGALIDTEGECFSDRALLECLLTRALEVLLPDSEVGRGIEEARTSLDEPSRERARGAAACLAALAVDAALTAADPRYRPTMRFARACVPGVRPWLVDAWARRMKGELPAREFGAILAQTMATLPSPR